MSEISIPDPCRSLKIRMVEEFPGQGLYELQCPICGSEKDGADGWMHHYKTEVFDRREDDLKGIHVTIGESVKIDTDASTNNPSKRRDGIKIYFYCEFHKGSIALSIYQHKGHTNIEWSDYDSEFENDKNYY